MAKGKVEIDGDYRYNSIENYLGLQILCSIGEAVIKRDKYLRQLIDKQHNGLIKVITGLRRVGKSYLLFNIYYDYLIANNVPV